MESFTQYLQDAARYPLLNKTQEIMLARQVQIWLHDPDATPAQKRMGKKAYEKLINCNLRLVVSVAKKFSKRTKRSEMLDLVQEGNLGLAHGIKKFDPERGYALSTYVYWWIRQSVSRYLSCNDRLIRLPSHAVEMLSKLRSWTPLFLEEHGRAPTMQECAKFCKTSVDRLQMYMDNAYDSISLDSKLGTKNGDGSLVDVISDGHDMMEDLYYQVRTGYIDDMLERLSEVDKKIVLMYFGLTGLEPMTLQAIGKETGVSRERVRQRLQRALTSLRVMANRISVL
jgi:RNA polymerase sigma factor (sigma-70 family)